MVKDVSETDGVQEAQADPDGTDGAAGPINAHGRAGCCLARSPQWRLGTQMDPYVGSHTHLVKTGLGQGPSVVLGLAEKAEVPPGVKFYHNNLFTTPSLVDEMTLRGYGSCDTM
ncbi:hypothetical protein PAMP_011487 [Pampus punctatissimus]